MVQMILFAKQKYDKDIGHKCMNTRGGRGGEPSATGWSGGHGPISQGGKWNSDQGPTHLELTEPGHKARPA